MVNDYSFLTKSQSTTKTTSGVDYSFLTRTTAPKETTKAPENVIKASDYKTVRLPLSLGGGEYITDKNGNLYLSERSQETLGGTLPGMERDHIVPVSLGGTSNIQNLQYLKSKPSFWQRIGGIFGKETSVQKSPNRQEGKLKVEQEAISGFQSGELSIGEARLMVAMENMRIQGLSPSQKEMSVAGNLGKGIQDAFKTALIEPSVDLVKKMGQTIVGSLDFLHRTGLQVVSGVGTVVSPTIVSLSKFVGDDQLKNISYDEIWKEELEKGTKRMLDIGRPDEFFRAKINNDNYVPMMLFNDEIQSLAKSSNEKMDKGDVKGSVGDMFKIMGVKAMTDWANPFYAFAIKGVRFDPTKARGKVLWQGTFKQPVNQIGKAKEVQGVLRLEAQPQKIVEVIKGRVKTLKEPDIRIWMKTTKDGKISVDMRNVGGDILNKDLLKAVGETTTQPGVTPIMSLPVKLRPSTVKPIKPVVTPTTIQKLDSLNPTGGVFAKYTPKQRATAELADNITTLDKTMGKSADEMITIYRGSNKGGEIVPGDFITTNKQLAKDYAGTSKVLEKRVKLSDILDDITEPLGEEYIYRPKSTPLKSNLINEASKYKTAEEYVAVDKEKLLSPGTIKSPEEMKLSLKTKENAELVSNDFQKQLEDSNKRIIEAGDQALTADIIARKDAADALKIIREIKGELPSKSQLISEWNKAQPLKSSLVEEAKKYKTAEDYVKAQGTPVYHGTNARFDSFDKAKLGVSTKAKSAEKGFWFVDNKDVAKGYGEYASEKPVRDILDQITIEERKGNWDKANELTIKAEELSAEYTDPIIIEAKLNLKNPMVYDANGKGFLATDKKVNDLIDQAIKDGKDGLIIKNLQDNVYSSDIPATHTIVFNDKSILTKSQLTDIWNKAQEVKTTTPTKPSIEPSFSRHYERIKEQYGFKDSVEFDRKTELVEKKKAFDFIQRSPEKALRIGYGYDEVPKGINQQVFRASLVASLNAQGKTALAQQVAKIQSSKMTEAAQTLAFGRLDIGTEAGIIKNITQARLEKIGKGLGVKEPEKRVEQARQVIERQAKDASKKVSELQKGKNTAKQLKEIDDLISSIIC